MEPKISTSLIVALLLGAALVVFSQVEPADGATQGEPGVTKQFEGVVVSERVIPQQAGTHALDRAIQLANSQIPLFGGINAGGYAPDYTGLVRYVWELPVTADLLNRHDWSQNLRSNYAVEIPYPY